MSSFFARLFGGTLASDLAEGARHAAKLPVDVIPEETSRRLRPRLPEGIWHFTLGQVLFSRIEQVESETEWAGHSGYVSRAVVVYGWRAHGGDLRLHRLDRALHRGDIERGSDDELIRLMQKPEEVRFVVAYRRWSRSHGLFALAARRPGSKAQSPESVHASTREPPPAVQHVAEALAPYATSGAEQEGLAFLRTVDPRDAWWWVLDLITRVALPDTLDALAARPGPREAGLAATAAHLRQLGQVPGARAEAIELFVQARKGASLSSFLDLLLRSLNAAEPFASMRSLEQALERWPSEGSSGHPPEGGGAHRAVETILEVIGGRRVPPVSGSRRWRLAIETEHGEARELEAATGQPFTIGRGSDCDFVLAREGMVARRHCRLTVDQWGQLTLCDLGSTGGTFVNGNKIKLSPLAPGDRISMGRVSLWVRRWPVALHPDD